MSFYTPVCSLCVILYIHFLQSICLKYKSLNTSWFLCSIVFQWFLNGFNSIYCPLLDKQKHHLSLLCPFCLLSYIKNPAPTFNYYYFFKNCFSFGLLTRNVNPLHLSLTLPKYRRSSTAGSSLAVMLTLHNELYLQCWYTLCTLALRHS